MAVHVTIRYVDGAAVSFDAEDWDEQRADGVDHIRVTVGSLAASLSGHSVYWCYPEGDTYVFGSGSLGYSDLPPEMIVTGGEIHARRIEYAPDLLHRHAKLGWWRPGEERP